MPQAEGGGRGGIHRKPKVRRKPKPYDPGTRRAAEARVSAPKPRPRLPEGPVKAGGRPKVRPKRYDPGTRRADEQKTRERRERRKREHEYRDVKSDADRRKAEAFKRTREYQKAVGEAATAEALRRTGRPTIAARRAEMARAEAAHPAVPSFGTRFIEGQYQTLRAHVEHPKTALKTAAQLGKFIVGAPAGLVEAGMHPRKTFKAAQKDIHARYGVLDEPGGEKKFRKRIEKHGGAAELVEGVGAATPIGGIAGRGAQVVARAGTFGKKAKKVATERPNIRESGKDSREQPISPNLIVNVQRAGRDTLRQKVQARRARGEDAPLEVRLAQEAGEVTHVRRRKTAKEQRTAVAREKSVAVQRIRTLPQREIRELRQAHRGLSKEERRGFKTAMQTGATTPGVARKILARRAQQIRAERAKLAKERPGYAVSRRRDELPEIQFLAENAEKVFTPNLRATVKAEQARTRRLAEGDPGLDPVQAQLRRYAPQAEVLGLQRKAGEGAFDVAASRKAVARQNRKRAARGEPPIRVQAPEKAAGESNAAYLRRVKKAAREKGLERPGYFPSEERARGAFAAFAVGGTKATEVPKRYTGSLFRQGVESADIGTFERGAIARPIKRRLQWNMVARNYDKHAVDTLAGKPMRDRKLVELSRDVENAGIDLSTIAFYNPGKFYEASRRTRQDEEGTEAQDPRSEDVDLGAADIETALKDSTATPAELRTRPEDFANSRGWAVVPRAVHDEIMAETRPSGALGRSYDIAKGKTARVLLATPAWLGFQTASNALLSGLARTGPVDAVRAQVWWRKLSKEERDAIEPELGVHGWYDDQTRLGAATNKRFVNAYRAFKTTGLYQAAHKANPLDAVFRADTAQNNFFRRAVFYTEAKREAYRRMGENASAAMKAQQTLHRLLKLDPADLIKAAAKDPKVFERHAQAVRDFLGDYTSYTAKERRVFGRAAMFYGFLRHSAKLTFYTLPVKHPLMTEIGLELGKLHDDEIRRIFGVSVPAWEQADLIVKGRKINLARLSPFFNSIQYSGPGSLLMVGSPMLQMVVDQFANEKVAFSQPWRINQSTAEVRRHSDVNFGKRLQILLGDLSRLSPYIRLAEKTGTPVSEPLRGTQSAESSILTPRPIKYKRKDAIERQRKRVEEQSKPTGEILREQLVPLLGEPAGPVIRKAREYAVSQGKGPKKPKRRKVRKRAQPLFGPSGGGSSGPLFDSGGESSSGAGPLF